LRAEIQKEKLKQANAKIKALKGMMRDMLGYISRPSCGEYHHRKKDYHCLSQPCPVEARVAKKLELWEAESLP
jgi:hypothetical protein